MGPCGTSTLRPPRRRARHERGNACQQRQTVERLCESGALLDKRAGKSLDGGVEDLQAVRAAEGISVDADLTLFDGWEITTFRSSNQL